MFDAFNMDIYTFIIAALVFVLSYVAFYKRDRKYHLPPGPKPLPIIGTLHKASMLSYENLANLQKSFGAISLFYAGPIRVVFLNSIEVAREAFVNQAKVVSDRGLHDSLCLRTLNPRMKGIIDQDYNVSLKDNRSASLTIFRNLGVGRSTMEERILEEAHTLVDVIKSIGGKAFDPAHTLGCSVANVILSVVLSKRFKHDDPELLRILKIADDEISCGANSIFIDSLNILRFIPPFRYYFKRMQECDQGLRDFMWKYTEQHMEDYDGQNSDFVYNWIEKNSNNEMDVENFKFILRDFIIAGTETTATSLKWTIVHLANNPRIQDKLHEEIDRVIGTDRPIHLKDRGQLPFLEALILEIQRKNTIVPTALPHQTREDTKIGGFDIPANTAVASNLLAIHYDENTFENPHEFRPERFIDSNGKFIKHPNVIPFGIGKRACLGELLARQELLLFTAALVQHFRFMPPEGETKIDDEGDLHFTYGPKKFEVRAVSR